MKRKTSSVPTRIYTYGCLAPVEGAEHVEDQLRRAHNYRNGLVEIERRRRERVAAAQRECDTLGAILEVIHSTETMIAEARREAKLARTGRGDPAEVAAQRELIDAALGDLALLKFFLARARMLAKSDEALHQRYAEITEAAQKETKALRGADTAPYWGTYLTVEKVAEAWRKAPDPPRFFRYTGEGRIVVQLQKGLSVKELLSGADTRLRMLPAAQLLPPVNPTSKRQIARAIAYGFVHFCRLGDMTPKNPPKSEYQRIQIRVGSNGRAPIWATFPVLLHRSLPDDGRIMWAWVIRKRLGVRYIYELQLTLEADSFAAPARERQAHTAPEAPRIIAVDIGTRDLPTGEVRSAFWLDAAGESGEVTSPLTRLSAPYSTGKGRRRVVPNDLTKTEQLRSIRDRHMDEVRAVLLEHRSALRARMPEAVRERRECPTPFSPDWVACWEYMQLTEHVLKWRSPARFVNLLRRWPPHEGDEAARAALEAYVKKDRHLLDWESHERSHFFGRRRHTYRIFAARIAAAYDVIVLAARDYRRTGPVPEKGLPSQGSENRSYMRLVAPGELREAIKSAAIARGARVVEVRLEGDTAWALDKKVCERLLASEEVANLDAETLAVKRARYHTDSIETWGRRRLGTDEKVDPLAGEDVSI